MVDLKHLGRPGSDYIEKEILTRELIYVDLPRQAVPINGTSASRHAHGNAQANGEGPDNESWPANGTENGKPTAGF